MGDELVRPGTSTAIIVALVLGLSACGGEGGDAVGTAPEVVKRMCAITSGEKPIKVKARYCSGPTKEIELSRCPAELIGFGAQFRVSGISCEDVGQAIAGSPTFDDGVEIGDERVIEHSNGWTCWSRWVPTRGTRAASAGARNVCWRGSGIILFTFY